MSTNLTCGACKSEMWFDEEPEAVIHRLLMFWSAMHSHVELQVGEIKFLEQTNEP